MRDSSGTSVGAPAESVEQLKAELAAARARVAELEAEQTRFRRAIDQAPVYISLTRGPELVFDYVNDLYETVVGKTDLIGKPLREAFPELAGQGLFELLEDIYRTGVPFSGVEMPIELERNGTLQTIYFDFIYQPICDETGAVEAVMSAGRDVTEQVLANRGIAQSHAELERSNRLIEARVQERSQEVTAANEELAAQSEELTMQAEVLQDQQLELEAANDQLNVQSTELQSQPYMLARIIDHAPAGMSYMNCDLVYEWVNPAQAVFWGMPVDTVIGRSVFDVFGPGTETALGPLLRGVLETGEPYYGKAFPFEVVVDGVARGTYWDFSYLPARVATGEVSGILVIALEVSDRVERERFDAERIQWLEEANLHKEQFLSILSHELRTPVNSIMGFASVLDDEVVGSMTAMQRQYLGKILASSEAMLSLINDLLDMSRIQAGKFAVDRNPLYFPDLCHEVCANLAPLADQKKLALRCSLPEDVPAVQADVQRIGQVLTNLVMNAIKFTPAGGQIDVQASVLGDVLRCEVRDTGIGVAPADQATIFDAFTQVDMSNTRKAGGTGLGLAISKSLVEAHGGEVGIESRPEQGSTFWFTLPLDT